jgi:hypothetical protein
MPDRDAFNNPDLTFDVALVAEAQDPTADGSARLPA